MRDTLYNRPKIVTGRDAVSLVKQLTIKLPERVQVLTYAYTCNKN